VNDAINAGRHGCPIAGLPGKRPHRAYCMRNRQRRSHEPESCIGCDPCATSADCPAGAHFDHGNPQRSGDIPSIVRSPNTFLPPTYRKERPNVRRSLRHPWCSCEHRPRTYSNKQGKLGTLCCVTPWLLVVATSGYFPAPLRYLSRWCRRAPTHRPVQRRQRVGFQAPAALGFPAHRAAARRRATSRSLIQECTPSFALRHRLDSSPRPRHANAVPASGASRLRNQSRLVPGIEPIRTESDPLTPMPESAPRWPPFD
jgi:hypothetical protein